MIAALLTGVAIGAALVAPASADVDLTSLDQRVSALEATAACQSGMYPFSVQQMHGTTKRTLVATNAGPDTFDHPNRYVWLVINDPSCAKDVTR